MTVATSNRTSTWDTSPQGIGSVSRGSASCDDDTRVYVRLEPICARTATSGRTSLP